MFENVDWTKVLGSVATAGATIYAAKQQDRAAKLAAAQNQLMLAQMYNPPAMEVDKRFPQSAALGTAGAALPFSCAASGGDPGILLGAVALGLFVGASVWLARMVWGRK